MNLKQNTPLIICIVIAILILGTLGLTGLPWSDEDDGTDVIDITDDPEEQEELLDVLLGSESERTEYPQSGLIVENDPYIVLVSTPLAVWYEGIQVKNYPLVVESGSDVLTGDRFHQVYPWDFLIGIGDTGDFTEPLTNEYSGSPEEISLAVAADFWERSDGAVIMGTDDESYYSSLPGIVLASYLNIPVILSDSMGPDVKDTLKALGVEYSLIFDDSEGYGTTYRFQGSQSIETLVMLMLEEKFGGVSYVTLTNPMDLGLSYALPGISSLSPYLTASRQGVISSALIEPLPPDQNFREEAPAFNANITTYQIKARLMETLGIMDNLTLLDDYLEDSPYLAIMGSAYSIPFYYTYLVPKGIMAGSDPRLVNAIDTGDLEPPYQDINDPALVPSDDIYADIDGDLTTHELASGRPIGINLEDASTLISRTLFYEYYLDYWIADSPISDLIGAEWKDSAFIHCGDDWNGYVLISAPAYVEVYEYLNRHGYTTYTTIGTGETVDSVTRFFQSSNLVFVLAHGSQTGFHMIDGYTAEDVKEWFIGPSSFVVTSCNVGNTDCPNLTNVDNSIAFAILRTGVNGFYGGMRYEYTGVYNLDDEYPLVASGSPRLSQIIIKLLTEEDLTTGMALRDAQNQYMDELLEPDGRDYDVAIKMLYGDPMFNPYEP